MPMSQVHITDRWQSVSQVQFDRPFHLLSSRPTRLYSIYALDTAAGAWREIRDDVQCGHARRADSATATSSLNSRTTARSSTPATFPTIGYNVNVELDDPRRRREEKLGALEEMAHRGDHEESLYQIFLQDSDWVTYHTVVSTTPDQIAIAPGYLKREWQANGRHYFEYDMGSTHILNFFSYISAKYDIRREQYKGINLEVYYTPGHEYNIDDMLASSKAGLDYYQDQFSPFQFAQFRIMEFPRYRGFAQSFSNTIPFSEGIGFIQRRKKKDDIDFTYFVTAHELGHQWWAHQLIGANVEGSNMMSETLAEYSALKVMEKQVRPRPHAQIPEA